MEKKECYAAYKNGELSTVKIDGFYAEIDNRWDKEFSSRKELDDWLTAEGYEFDGLE